jgi:hypothetical protein
MWGFAANEGIRCYRDSNRAERRSSGWRGTSARAFVKGRSLQVIRPTRAFFPLAHYCWNGRDGAAPLVTVLMRGSTPCRLVSRYQIQTEPV